MSLLHRHAVPALVATCCWVALLAPSVALSQGQSAGDATAPFKATSAERGANGRPLDRSGRRQIGEASYYAPKFHGRTMADGTPMDPRGDNAASKTLPLGTTARVTNLDSGESAVVTIQDRGPYVRGRIVDLSPRTAREIGLTRKEGVAPVEVAPLAVPQADGSVKRGAGATRR